MHSLSHGVHQVLVLPLHRVEGRVIDEELCLQETVVSPQAVPRPKLRPRPPTTVGGCFSSKCSQTRPPGPPPRAPAHSSSELGQA